jgi:anaerobic selenocysteine-containing dehydrogenase
MGQTSDSTHVDVQRRDFLKRAAVVAWSTPVIFTMMSRPAAAQVVVCGDCPGCAVGDPCTTPDSEVTCPTGTQCLGGEIAPGVDGCLCTPMP